MKAKHEEEPTGATGKEKKPVPPFTHFADAKQYNSPNNYGMWWAMENNLYNNFWKRELENFKFIDNGHL